tara:strand:- start:1168 stop:1551 length:384 start_codon:yes stop_codon:yes gene_type:complete
MPTKKRRVGFIPRSDVLEIINRLSIESNLSNSKIINILVEEALYQRGILDIADSFLNDKDNIKNLDKNIKIKRINFDENLSYSLRNKLLKDKYRNIQETKNDFIDNEIYEKFLMFLTFQEKMKKINE